MFEDDPESQGMETLGRRVFWRSFFLETLWNYERMQNVGFLFCIQPVLKRLYPGEQERHEAIERHLEQINTHPAMGPLLTGLTARLEGDLQSSCVLLYRKRVMSALSAFGDRIFWSHLRPLTSVVGVALSLCLVNSFLGSIVLLLVYNTPQMLLRSRGFQTGWEQGLGVLRLLCSSKAEGAVRLMRRTLSLGLGMVAGFAVVSAGQPWTGLGWNQIQLPVVLVLVVLGAASFLLIRRDVSLTLLMYPAILVTVVVFALLNV